MELERMRNLLATEAMGWTSQDGVWYDKGGQRVQNGCGYAQMVVYWHPDTDWAQCGLVIEAMREKGWIWNVEDITEGETYVEVLRGDHSQHGEAQGEEKYARMLAAARALEATDEVS